LTAAFDRIGPGAAVELKLEGEGSGEPWSEGSNRGKCLDFLAFTCRDKGFKASDWNRCLVRHIDSNKQDIFIVVIDFHLHGGEAGFEGGRSCAVFVAHLLTCLPLNEALLQFNATASGFRTATTSRLLQRCGGLCRSKFGTRFLWIALE
jgi:hypothetical protein